MPVKIRLQRFGRKGYAYYHIVIADSRAPRDGRSIERIGSYNPNTNPSTIDLKFDRALYWMQVGAQPTDTTRNILSDEGVPMMKHLLEGVKKGALDEAEAEKRFAAWKELKVGKTNKTKEQVSAEKAADAKARLTAEKEVNKAKAAELAKKLADIRAAQAEAEAAAAPITVEVKEEAPVAAEVKEEVKAEPKVEAPVAVEAKEEVKAEPKVEAPVAVEAKAEPKAEVKEEAPVAAEAKVEAKKDAPVAE